MMRRIIFSVMIFAALFAVSCDEKKTGLEDKLVGAINAGKLDDVKLELSEETFRKSAGNYSSHDDFIKARLNKNLDKLNRSPLIWASLTNKSNLENTKKTEESRLEIVKYLLDKGADCNIKDSNGWTPLFWASWSGMDEIAALLVEKCTNVNDATNRKWTPLMAASIKGWDNVVELLLKKGADKNLKNNENHTALDLAKKNAAVFPEYSERYQATIELLENCVKQAKPAEKITEAAKEEEPEPEAREKAEKVMPKPETKEEAAAEKKEEPKKEAAETEPKEIPDP